MKNPNTKTKVVHSQSKAAWNVVSTKLAGKFKIARVPYVSVECEEASEIAKAEAREHADFISYCFNNSTEILSINKW